MMIMSKLCIRQPRFQCWVQIPSSLIFWSHQCMWYRPWGWGRHLASCLAVCDLALQYAFRHDSHLHVSVWFPSVMTTMVYDPFCRHSGMHYWFLNVNIICLKKYDWVRIIFTGGKRFQNCRCFGSKARRCWCAFIWISNDFEYISGHLIRLKVRMCCQRHPSILQMA